MCFLRKKKEIQKHVANYLVAQNPPVNPPVLQSWQDQGSYHWEYGYQSRNQMDDDQRSASSNPKSLSHNGNYQRNLGPLIVAGAGAGALVAGPIGAATGAAIVCTAATIQKISGDVKEVFEAREFRKIAVAEIRERRHQATNDSQSTALYRTRENCQRDDHHAPIIQRGRRQLSDRGNQRQLEYYQGSEDDSDDRPGRHSGRRQLSDRGNQRQLEYYQGSEDDSDDRPGRHSGRRQLSDRGNQRQLEYYQGSEDDSDDRPGRHSGRRQIGSRANEKRVVRYV